jgi:hypothetical protein
MTRAGGVVASNLLSIAATPVICDRADGFFRVRSFSNGCHGVIGGSARNATVIGRFMKKAAGPCGNLDPRSRRPERLPLNSCTFIPLYIGATTGWTLYSTTPPSAKHNPAESHGARKVTGERNCCAAWAYPIELASAPFFV